MLARCQRDDLLREAGTKFLLGMLVGTVVVGCSMFGPGLGVSVY